MQDNNANLEQALNSIAKSIRGEDYGQSLGCSVYRSTSQSVASTTYTTVIHDSVVYDTGGNYSTSTGKYTVSKDGKYMITFHAMIENLTTGKLQYLYINQGGTTIIGTKHRAPATNLEMSGTLVTTTFASVGDEFYTRLYHDYGSNRNALGTRRWSGFTVTYLGS